MEAKTWHIMLMFCDYNLYSQLFRRMLILFFSFPEGGEACFVCAISSLLFIPQGRRFWSQGARVLLWFPSIWKANIKSWMLWAPPQCVWIAPNNTTELSVTSDFKIMLEWDWWNDVGIKESRQLSTEADVFFNRNNRRDTVPLQMETVFTWYGSLRDRRVPFACQLPYSQGVADTNGFSVWFPWPEASMGVVSQGNFPSRASQTIWGFRSLTLQIIYNT